MKKKFVGAALVLTFSPAAHAHAHSFNDVLVEWLGQPREAIQSQAQACAFGASIAGPA